LSLQNQPLSQAIAAYQKYFHSGEINFEVQDKDRIFKLLHDKYHDAPTQSELDGVYFEYEDFWFNVRASNTEPKMRLNLEAVSEEKLQQKVAEVSNLLQS